MRPVEICPDVYWVGAVDWECRTFHVYMTAPTWTTYNAFLIKDEKIALFDSVKAGHGDEMLCRVAHVTPLDKVDYLIVNHVEMDHSGSLPELVARTKPEKIRTSPRGERAMRAHFDCADWPIEVVKTGSSISLGKRTLRFLETRMLHWPDNMATFIPEDGLLISSDAFGQNWATSERFADQVDRSLLRKQLDRYFANIVLPFSPIAQKTIETIESMGLDVRAVCPDHGLMFRTKDDVAWVIARYKELAAQKQKKKAVLVYDTMWHSTERMAHAIATGLAEHGVSFKLMNLHVFDHSDVMEEVWDAAAVFVGSPTHNNGMLPKVADMLTYMKGLKPKGKIGGAFGSYGWSGEAVKDITAWLEAMGMDLPVDGVRILYVPTHEQLAACVEMGRTIGKAIADKLG
ncbi:FprA family A-type flavoprotein [Solidesulfovibrio sp.]|uniref:FprA family A-type flavoprotein n=1 Tax=Solidesulfovibrio sp. TaxID=2910990 RepID=UPI002B209E69|nr:flavodoxin domain-containing protein [Solidesulfovibrio sp.]MEA4856902.1 flavodoxin domain-containing protein [Solidesulfovibrio sp.]